MYSRTDVTLVDGWGNEQRAELVYGSGVALMVIPRGREFVELRPLRRDGDRLTWGYEHGISVVARDVFEDAFRRGSLHQYMDWVFVPREEE